VVGIVINVGSREEDRFHWWDKITVVLMITRIATGDQETFQKEEKNYWKQDIGGWTANLVELLIPIGEQYIGLRVLYEMKRMF
jgi:hypothetical protein